MADAGVQQQQQQPPPVALSAAASAASAAAPSASQLAARPSHHRHHHTITHSQFATKEKGDSSIPPHVKAYIIEQSPKRRPVYEAEKVLTRNETKYASRDFKSIALEKVKRRQEVYRCGFFADSRETYKSLGEPILDSDELMIENMQLDSNILKRQAQSKGHEFTAKTKDAANANASLISQGKVIINTSNGYDMLKGRIQLSRSRLFAVKFGVPFNEVCPMPDAAAFQNFAGVPSEEQVAADVTNPLSPLTSRRQEGRLDYRNLVLDPEKAAYYQALLERPLSVGAGDERPQLPAPGPRDRARDQGKDAAATRTTGRTAAASHHDRPLLMRFRNAARQQQQQKPPPPLSAGRQELASWRQSAGTGAETSGRRPNGLTPAAEQKLCRVPRGTTSRPPSAGKLSLLPQMDALDVKALETALKISRPTSAENVSQLLVTQEGFYAQREKLNQTLVDELARLDAERPTNFMLKYKALQVGASSVYVDDIASMRRRVRQQKLAEKQRLTRDHPWFEEMVKTVFYCNGTKTELSPIEQKLLRRIREHIEKKLEWNQAVLISLLKMVPQANFPDLQKIFRFIKTSEAMGEREYLEAIELSGHTF